MEFPSSGETMILVQYEEGMDSVHIDISISKDGVPFLLLLLARTLLTVIINICCQIQKSGSFHRVFPQILGCEAGWVLSTVE